MLVQLRASFFPGSLIANRETIPIHSEIDISEAVMEADSEEQSNEGSPPDDERESCLMCGACEVLGQGCVLHASPEEV